MHMLNVDAQVLKGLRSEVWGHVSLSVQDIISGKIGLVGLLIC